MENDFTLFAACDDVYFQEHAPALAMSAVHYQTPVIICVINPSIKSRVIASAINKQSMRLDHTPLVEIKFVDFDLSHPGIDKRALFSCYRFIAMPRFNTKKCMIIDVDCLINRRVHWPKESFDVAMYFREPLPNCNEYETYSTHIAAGCVMINNTPNGMKFIREVAAMLANCELRWFIDQFALYNTYERLKSGPTKFSQVDFQYIDWEFSDASMIWTGKGSRKYDNDRYVQAKSKFHNMLVTGAS